MTATRQDIARPTERRMLADLWPVLAAAALGLVPFTIFSNFLVGIAGDGDLDVAGLGMLRGFGGLAALVIGLCCAPLLDKLPRPLIAATSLLVLGAACLFAVIGSSLAWIVFCLAIGAATSTLGPALTAMAADRYTQDAVSGRAATMVSSTQTLTAVLAAPLLAWPALFWGWRGDLVAVAALVVILVPVLLRRTGDRTSHGSPAARPGYRTVLRTVLSTPGTAALLLLSCARTAAFMGQLAFLAAFYSERFGLGPGLFSLVWTTSGAAFFAGNWCCGWYLKSVPRTAQAARLAVLAAVVATVAIIALFFTRQLVPALALTALVAVAHAVVAAVVVTLLVRRAAGFRGTVLGLSASGQSLGVFLGTAAAAAGLAAGGWGGVGVTLGAVTALGAVAALVSMRQVSGNGN